VDFRAEVGKRIYPDGRVGETKDLLQRHLKGKKRLGKEAQAALERGWDKLL
jgi:hypothetical protein